MRRRLDAEMVRRGLVGGRAQAKQLIDDGRVLVAGTVALKPTRLVDPAEALLITGGPPRFVGRGGEKLDAALDRFRLDATGLAALDAGASTGGFTDCLLQRGAASVVALDVGHGQIHERLRADVRVDVLERTNLRHVEPRLLRPDGFDAVVADLSFISLTAVMHVLVGCCRDRGWMVVLVKPQFEVGRTEASRGRGVITDPALWRSSLAGVLLAAESAGASMMGAMVSPLHGADGNTEFLMHLTPGHLAPGPTAGAAEVDAGLILDEVVREATRP